MSTSIKKNPPPVQPPQNPVVSDTRTKEAKHAASSTSLTSTSSTSLTSTPSTPSTSLADTTTLTGSSVETSIKPALGGNVSTFEESSHAARSSLLGEAGAVPSAAPSVRRDIAGASDNVGSSASHASPRSRGVALSTAPTVPSTGATFAMKHAPSMKEIEAGKIMEKGQGGPAVKEMQDRLTQLGFGVQQTGEFGPTTEGVLREFQKAHNVQPTGKLGPTTLAALEKAEMAQRPDFSALKKAVGHGEILGEGDKGAAVVDLQRLLSKRGFPTDTDGSFGPNTAASVKKFQAANNIVQNGQVGVTTLKALESAQGGGQSLPGGGSVLNVPFYKQTDNYTMPDRTCNSSACAMAAKYLGANISGDDQYLRRVLQHGDTTDHSAQTRALNDFGIKSSFHYNLDFKDIDKALAQGKPVVIGINHRGPRHAPTGGHMVTVIGKQGNDYIVNDPYGSLNDGYTGAVENGKGVRYSRAELEARWTVDGPNTGWGRIFS